jgi:hypothetical protein
LTLSHQLTDFARPQSLDWQAGDGAASGEALTDDQLEYLRMQREGFFDATATAGSEDGDTVAAPKAKGAAGGKKKGAAAGGASQGAGSTPAPSPGSGPTVLEAKPGERRIRRLITWTDDATGDQRSRELIISDKSGAPG